MKRLGKQHTTTRTTGDWPALTSAANCYTEYSTARAPVQAPREARKEPHMSKNNTTLQGTTPEERLRELMHNNDYEQVMPGGAYEAEFNALLAKYGGDLYHTALAAFTLGAELARRS